MELVLTAFIDVQLLIASFILLIGCHQQNVSLVRSYKPVNLLKQKKYKENGWALIGLYQALLKQNKKSEAQLVKYRYDKAWHYADIPLKSSVF